MFMEVFNMPIALVGRRFPHVVRAEINTPQDFGFELRHLRYFVAVAEHLHFGRAAKALNMSQPPLSRQIRDLERCIGTQLFDRCAGGVVLTGAGDILLVESKRILEHISRSLSVVRRAHGGIGQSPVVFFQPRPFSEVSLIVKTDDRIPPNTA